MGFLAVAVLITAAVFYYLQPLVVTGGPPGLLQTVIMIVVAAMGALGSLLAGTVILPMKKIGKDVEQIVRGNYSAQVYEGKLTKGKFKRSDELAQMLMAF